MTWRLRPDQEKVAAYRGGYMAVPAVPGAGKTTVLAYLAADLIAGGLTEPGRILIVTYTHSAVGNFKGRIGGLLEERGLPRSHGYEVRTIHSLAMQIVRERPEALGWADDFAVLDESRLDAILERLTTRWIEAHRPMWESFIQERLEGPWRQKAEDQWPQKTRELMKKLIQALKARRLSPAEAHRLTRDLPETSALRWAADLFADYERALAQEGAVDFGDLVVGACRLLEQEPDLLERLRQRWTYIFEDEAQDSYRLQEQVLRLLAGPDGNLVRVGDANQAIMGTFTSAEPDLFRRFAREEGVALRPLTMASRSNPDIIDLANELVRWCRQEHPEVRCREALEEQLIQPVPPDFTPTNPRPAEYRTVCRTCPTFDDEMLSIARLAARSVQKAPEKSVGVLLPTNNMAREMAERIGRLGAQVELVGKPAGPERLRVAGVLLDALDYLGTPHDDARRNRALERLAAAAEDEAAKGVGRPLSGEALLDGWLPHVLLPADELLLQMAADLGLAGEEQAIAHYLALLARRLMQEEPSLGLSEIARELTIEASSLGWLAEVLYDRKGFEPQPGVVYVSTCHSAKGLEWDTVYVAALTRAEFPAMVKDKFRSEYWFLTEEQANPEALALAELDRLTGRGAADDLDPVTTARLDQIGERLRLFYVAITRAKENLLLSCHQKDSWDKKAFPTLAYQHLKQIVDGRR